MFSFMYTKLPNLIANILLFVQVLFIYWLKYKVKTNFFIPEIINFLL